jgi:hypothetical protein
MKAALSSGMDDEGRASSYPYFCLLPFLLFPSPDVRSCRID